MAKSALLIQMIDLIVARPGVTIADLSAELGRSERSIYRWLKEITDQLALPLRCRAGGYYLEEWQPNDAVRLTPHELLAIRLGLLSAPFGAGSPIRQSAEAAWSKLCQSAPADRLHSAQRLATGHQVAVNAPAADMPPAVVDTIERAIESNRRVRAVYRSQKSGRVKSYTINPYALAFRRHSWYVVGYCAEHDEVVQFKLVRFQSVHDTGQRFAPPSDFSLDEFFKFSWEAWAGGEPTKVRVRFSPKVSAMITESRRHPTQSVEPQPDGSVVFEATVAGIQEIAIWILGYGREAVVLAPQELRDLVVKHASGMLDSYGRESRDLGQTKK